MIPDIALSVKVQKMLHYAVNTQSKEVQGFGKCEFNKEQNLLWVTDIIIPQQYVGPAHVDTPPELLEQCITMLGERGETLSQYPMWWHSHPGGGSSVSPSGTDIATIKSLAAEFEGVVFGIVTNRDKAYHGYWAAQAVTEYGTMVLDGKCDVRVEVPPEDKKLAKQVADMMKAVTEPPRPDPKVHKGSGTKHGGSGQQGGLPFDDDAHWHIKMLQGGELVRRWCTEENCKEDGRQELESNMVNMEGGNPYHYPKAEAGMDDDGEDDEDEGWYMLDDNAFLALQESFPPATPQNQMTLDEFKDWFMEAVEA